MPRSFFLVVSILGQMAFVIGVILRFNEYFAFFYAASLVLSLVAFLWVVNSQINPAYKIAWIIPIMLFPIFGGLFYLFLGRSKMSRKTQEKMKNFDDTVRTALFTHKTDIHTKCLQMLEKMNGDAAIQSRYISEIAGYPPYPDAVSEYLPIGEEKFEKLREELKKAEHYIFLEYFIIEEGVMWNQILEILQEKAAQGVDVRLIYDDLGCLYTLPHGYHRKLEAMGIKCCVFNPLIPLLSLRQNNRDHRKITVIDGHTGFTGGINLADEYINEIVKYGHWKDTAIMLKGPAVWNLTVMFLAMWDYLRGVEEDFSRFKIYAGFDKAGDAYGAEVFYDDSTALDSDIDAGCVQPFADSPLDNEPVSETIYLNMIYKAKKFVYITTPYLIIANEMVTALCSAAKGGVDVRIITPHKWDKRLVHMVTRTYYKTLVDSGVKIYEYTPGFMHGKTFVVDDFYGVVGTINMDYRSLYLHFECGVWMFNTPSVLELRQDFLDTLNVCHQITPEDFKEIRWYGALAGSVLRVFAPIL
ncbi:MAG: cardiolipin synthase [Bacillota bacterium]|nr:cardiolipin synthase [Bacillota bacterium]MDW7678161.1 cardiolipin synthase [Bacillota bacterium]